MRWGGIIVLSLTLVGCVTQAERGTPISLTQIQISNIEAAVRTHLREPTSVSFLGTPKAARQPNGTTVVCGAVNSRNEYGGMTDWVPYIGNLQGDRFTPIQVGGSSVRMEAVIMTCRQNGVHD